MNFFLLRYILLVILLVCGLQLCGLPTDAGAQAPAKALKFTNFDTP
jgi:hypothetical protein